MIRSISTHVPLIVLPSPVSSHFKGSSRLSAFTPRTAAALRAGLFRSPERLSMLRREAVDRFLWWRAVQKWGVDDDGIAREGGFGANKELEDDHDDDDEDARWEAPGGIWKRRPRRRAATISASKSRRTLSWITRTTTPSPAVSDRPFPLALRAAEGKDRLCFELYRGES